MPINLKPLFIDHSTDAYRYILEHDNEVTTKDYISIDIKSRDCLTISVDRKYKDGTIIYSKKVDIPITSNTHEVIIEPDAFLKGNPMLSKIRIDCSGMLDMTIKDMWPNIIKEKKMFKKIFEAKTEKGFSLGLFEVYSDEENNYDIDDLNAQCKNFLKTNNIEGTPIRVDFKADTFPVLIVKLLDEKKFLNSLYGKSCYGGFVYSNKKEKTMKTIKDINKIVITKGEKDNEVLLRAYDGNDVIARCTSKCSSDDIFDFNIGAKLAVDRLYERYDMTPKPKRKLYNGKIFVRYIDKTWISLFGKEYKNNDIYAVKDGCVAIGGHVINNIYEDMTDNDLTSMLLTYNVSIGGKITSFIDGYFVRSK